jgi:methyltransferase-like protein
MAKSNKKENIMVDDNNTQRFFIYELEKEVTECFVCKSHSLMHNSGVVICVDCAEMRFLDGAELDEDVREAMLNIFLPTLYRFLEKIQARTSLQPLSLTS